MSESVRTTIRIEKEIFQKLKIIALAQDRKLNDVIEEALKDYVEKNKALLEQIKKEI